MKRVWYSLVGPLVVSLAIPIAAGLRSLFGNSDGLQIWQHVIILSLHLAIVVQSILYASRLRISIVPSTLFGLVSAPYLVLGVVLVSFNLRNADQYSQAYDRMLLLHGFSMLLLPVMAILFGSISVSLVRGRDTKAASDYPSRKRAACALGLIISLVLSSMSPAYLILIRPYEDPVAPELYDAEVLAMVIQAAGAALFLGATLLRNRKVAPALFYVALSVIWVFSVIAFILVQESDIPSSSDRYYVYFGLFIGMMALLPIGAIFTALWAALAGRRHSVLES